MTAPHLLILGGGAAGFFAAITCAETNPHARVTILEKSRALLSKVRISGGGRCNVTHACFDPDLLVQHYPRGDAALRGPFTRFQSRDTIEWFEQRGVPLKTESDGRVFPVTDRSETIVDCLLNSARNAGVEIRTQVSITSIERDPQSGFVLRTKAVPELFHRSTSHPRTPCPPRSGGGALGERVSSSQPLDSRASGNDDAVNQTGIRSKQGESFTADRILLATGSNPQGYAWASALGHSIEPPVPSLFTFTIDDTRLYGLAGISVPNARVEIEGTSLSQSGPLLITHWGLSGPAILKLSAWGARLLHDRNYQAQLLVDWLPDRREDEVRQDLQVIRADQPRRYIGSSSPFGLPSRLWLSLIGACGLDGDRRWTEVSKHHLATLIDQLKRGRYEVRGKGEFKEEFVTCGGVNLDEVNFKTMESRLCPGLYFAGEILDIDGLTGGFNFQAAWTTGWLAGRAMAA